MRSGFSLLELSIVLVIIGLLAGGVMTGQSLIRAAELRAVVTEQNKFITALNAFRDKYQAVPGDFKSATAFWGKDNAACASQTGTAATPGTCNGDGDGGVGWSSVANGSAETFQGWKQLALAGMLEGSYTGLAGPTAYGGSYFQHIPDTNSPRSKFTNASWGFASVGDFPGDSYTYKANIGNGLMFGGTTPDAWPNAGILKPEEAWNVDTKLDDGKPGTGRVVTFNWPTCSTSTSLSDTSGSYRLTTTSASCGLLFLRVF